MPISHLGIRQYIISIWKINGYCSMIIYAWGHPFFVPTKEENKYLNIILPRKWTNAPKFDQTTVSTGKQGRTYHAVDNTSPHVSIQTVNKLKELGYEIQPWFVHPLQITSFFGTWTTLCEENCLQTIKTLKMCSLTLFQLVAHNFQI